MTLKKLCRVSGYCISIPNLWSCYTLGMYIGRHLARCSVIERFKWLNSVGDTISMQVEPWFSREVGKDFRKRENGDVFYYTIFGKDVVESIF